MGFFATLTSQLSELLRSQTAARRLMLATVVVGALAMLVFMAARARTGGYVTLFSGLQPSEGIEAAALLRRAGIPVRMTDGGATLQVGARQADEAQLMLAMEGLPGSGTVGYEMMDRSSIGQNKFQLEKNYLRMREGELTRTLLLIREIERARVHLAIPEPTAFVRDQKPASASVVVRLRRGATLDERQIRGIIHFVAHGVEGLAPENVTVIDDLGNPLTPPPAQPETQATSAQQQFKTQFEERLRANIESMLENVVGRHRVSARVTADFDFSTQRQMREIYNPDEQEPIIRTQRTSVRTDRAAGDTGGLPGSASNLPGGEPASGGTAGGVVGSDSTTEYAVSKTVQESTVTVPQPRRVSVAVLVDGVYRETKPGDPTSAEYQPRSPEEMAQLENLVKAAIGFTNDDTRQDVVTVACAPFKLEGDANLDAPRLAPETRKLIEQLIEWGIVGLIGLLLVFLVLKPAVQQIVVAPAARPLQALPAGAGAAGAIGGGAAAGALPGMEGTAMTQMPDFGMDVPLEALGSNEASLALKRQHLAAQQAKFSQSQAQKVHREVVETAKNDPKKTVGLLRQWMDEA